MVLTNYSLRKTQIKFMHSYTFITRQHSTIYILIYSLGPFLEIAYTNHLTLA